MKILRENLKEIFRIHSHNLQGFYPHLHITIFSPKTNANHTKKGLIMKPEAQELQERAVNDLLTLWQAGQRDISLQAPTGSGKTRIMARLMQEILERDSKAVFLVSTLSKGKLAMQNYESFVDLARRRICPKLKPFYISAEKDGKNTEYGVYIDRSANVYVLPTSQYTKNSKIHKESALLAFLQECEEQGRRVICIRDESHIATNNLNELKGYFKETFHFSATAKSYDVCINEREAEEAGLIKSVEWRGDSDKELEEELREALQEFKGLQRVYRKEGIHPCCIIQISNENKAQQELPSIIKVVEQAGLNWVCFVDKEQGYSTNTVLAKKKNKALWQKEVKENASFVDVVIFKMVITEGYDIPRACMLYQVRDSQSKQLDEQVIGRVRRNPALGYFDKLDSNTQEVFSKAFVYGVRTANDKRKEVRLKGREEVYDLVSLPEFRESGNEIIKEFQPFLVTIYNEVPLSEIEIDSTKASEGLSKSIFQAFRELEKSEEKVREKYREYVQGYEDFCVFSVNLEAIKGKVRAVVNDYEKYLNVIDVGPRENVYSFYNESKFGFSAESWIWGSENDEVCLDSEAEKEWAKLLKTLAKECAKSIEINEDRIYLFGKNFIEKSNVKYEYYDIRKRVSYPDFIFKDKCDRVHIFEVKSTNVSKEQTIESAEYREKIERLKEAYLEASKKIGAKIRERDSKAHRGEAGIESSEAKITGYIFYIPIKKGDEWDIWCCENGGEKAKMNQAMFEKYLKQANRAISSP